MECQHEFKHITEHLKMECSKCHIKVHIYWTTELISNILWEGEEDNSKTYKVITHLELIPEQKELFDEC
jgi:hypothetical protein